MTGCESSNGALEGTYVSNDLYRQRFTFSGGNKINMNAFGIASGSGTYEITGNKIKIKYKLYGIGDENEWVQSFSSSGNSIYILGVEFVKETPDSGSADNTVVKWIVLGIVILLVIVIIYNRASNSSKSYNTGSDTADTSFRNINI